MIKAATTQIPLPRMTRSAVGWGHLLLTLTLRLLLLGIGGSFAAVVGVAIAQLYPAQTQEPPSLEKLVQQANLLLQGQLQWSQPNATQIPAASAPVSSASVTLPSSERQQLQVELIELQAELQTLTSQSAEPLAHRVQEIQKQIQLIQERLSSASVVTTAPFVSTAASGENRLMVTLPSDALFTAETTLQPDQAILDSILTDLQRYPGAAIQVSAHTDDQGTVDHQYRSLEQAKSVQQYLSTQLPEDVHWVTIGYGYSRPLVPNNSLENRQRNRRVEILIKPE